MRVVDTRVMVGRHFIESNHNIEGSEWVSDSDSRHTDELFS